MKNTISEKKKTRQRKHKWEHVCFHDRSGWMKETMWCPLCGTLRENDRSGRYHYRYPQMSELRKHFNKKPQPLLQRYDG